MLGMPWFLLSGLSHGVSSLLGWEGGRRDDRKGFIDFLWVVNDVVPPIPKPTSNNNVN